MKSHEIEDEITNFHKEIKQLKLDFNSGKEKLVRLGLEYQNSKRLGPLRRYRAMKVMIKTVIRSWN